MSIRYMYLVINNVIDLKMSNSKDEIDSFRHHFERLLTDGEVERLSTNCDGNGTVTMPALETSGQFTSSQLRPNLRHAIDVKNQLSTFTTDLISVLNDYKDLFYSDFACCTSRERSDEIQFAYSLHALNHVLKSRHRILKNNTKLRQASASNESSNNEELSGDQGLTRPKVLILLPFRRMALNVVKTMIDLLFLDDEKKGMVMNKKRFFNEYGTEEPEETSEEPSTSVSGSKRPRLERPLDYKETFRGNIDDCFRLGLSIGKGGKLKIYTDFYQSDVILASPLGLRMALGAESEKEYDYDFLSSIEVLIFDRADVFLMQNWSHVIYILEHLHKQPRESHGVDFSRVRTWNLNGWSKYYRQTVVFSSITTPELRTIYSSFCRNFAGRIVVSVEKPSAAVGSLARVVVSLPHAFQRFSCDDLLSESDRRYEYFIQKVLPQYTDSSMRGTLIYVPSYYDFVRLRNYFKKNDNNTSYVQICEYTSDKKVSRARDLFFHGDKHFLLYTERFHFYHRYRIRGIRNLIFYQSPTYPHFYSEMCNAMLDDRSGAEKVMNITCAVLFSQFDALRLAGVLGREKARELLKSDQGVHILVTE